MTQSGNDAVTRDIIQDMQQRVTPRGTSRHGLVIGIETYHETRLILRWERDA